jgi:hypothetical protein
LRCRRASAGSAPRLFARFAGDWRARSRSHDGVPYIYGVRAIVGRFARVGCAHDAYTHTTMCVGHPDEGRKDERERDDGEEGERAREAPASRRHHRSSSSLASVHPRPIGVRARAPGRRPK